MDVLFFIKFGNTRGIHGLQIRDARGVPIHGETPMRLDNIGKKMQGALYLYSLAPDLIASIQAI